MTSPEDAPAVHTRPDEQADAEPWATLREIAEEGCSRFDQPGDRTCRYWLDRSVWCGCCIARAALAAAGPDPVREALEECRDMLARHLGDRSQTARVLIARADAALAGARPAAEPVCRTDVGRCGNSPRRPIYGCTTLTTVCELDAGHAGWHRDGGTEWGPVTRPAGDDTAAAGPEPIELAEKLCPVLDHLISQVIRDVGDPATLRNRAAVELAKVAAEHRTPRAGDTAPDQDTEDRIDLTRVRVQSGAATIPAITAEKLIAEIDRLRSEVVALHSWDGLMSLLDEHWPVDIFRADPMEDAADSGPRIVALLRWVAALRAAGNELAAASWPLPLETAKFAADDPVDHQALVRQSEQVDVAVQRWRSTSPVAESGGQT